MLFEPQTRSVKVDTKELDKNVGIDFKVEEGIFVQGETQPPISDTQVSIIGD